MTIAFRYLPYLVQHNVMDQMALIEVFSIFPISKKSQALVKSYFNRLKWKVMYAVGEYIRIRRSYRFSVDYSNRMNQLAIRLEGNYFDVTVWNAGIPDITIPAAETPVLNFAIDLFPKPILSLSFGSEHEPEDFLNTIYYVRSLKIPLKKVVVGSQSNEFLGTILKECSDVKRLSISSRNHAGFEYDFRTNPPFKFDFFALRAAGWVTKDHLVNLFMGCKKVILNNVSEMRYNDQELFEIGQKWLEAPEMELLEIWKAYHFSEDIGKLPGAVQVERVTFAYARSFRVQLEFGARECYKMKKADGTPAIIYHYGKCITFRTSFETAEAGEGIPFMVERPHRFL